MIVPFADLVVVELAGSLAGSFAGRLFADHGATVLKVEPPSGDPTRALGEPWRDGGTFFAALNTSKRSVTLDLTTSTGRSLLARLLERADLAIESSSPGPLYPVADHLGHGRLVRLCISPFGLTGPYAGYRSTPFTDYAAGGQMLLSGEPDREPLQGAGRQAEYAAGSYGFIGAMAALWERDRSGRGQTVDVSHMESMASLHQWTTVRWTHGRFIQQRIGNRYDSTHPITIYRCKDGHVAVSASSDDQGQRMIAGIGLGHLLDDPRFATGVARLQHADAFDAALEPWLMAHTVEEIVTLCQDLRVPVGPVPGMLDLIEDPHLTARGFWQTPAGDGLRYPGPPFRMSAHPWRIAPAPALGEATRPLLAALGVNHGDALRQTLITKEPPAESPASTDPLRLRPRASSSPSTQHSALSTHRDGPLTGVRVLDLSRVWAGPLAGRILGDLGADVIRVEATTARGAGRVSDAVVQHSKRYPNNEAGERPWNREGMFNKFNRNKRAITLQLNTPAGRAVFERLVQVADVVLENYSPRVMPQLGLGYDRLRELNPGIIYIGMPGYGWSGPSRDWVAYGTTLEPGAGLSSLMGYPDSGPYKSGVAWADPVAGLHAAAAIMIALRDRAAEPGGRGQAIELAQLEAMIGFISEEILAAQVRGSDPPRRGNRHPCYAPQGVYRCGTRDAGRGMRDTGHGRERWLALTVTTDAEWQALCRVAGLDEAWAAWRLDERLERQDAIDAALAAWTARHDQMYLMHLLQLHGVAAVAAFDARQLVEDPHLTVRGFFPLITHPDAGTYPFPGQPIHLSETPATFRRPAPGLGEHNREVLLDLLGMTAAEVDALYAGGIMVDRPPGT